MSELIEQVSLWVREVIAALGYPGIFGLMVLENLFPPIPSEMVMTFAGFLVSEGELDLAWVMVAGTLGSLSGAALLYALGYWFSPQRVRAWLAQFGRYLLLKPDDLDHSLNFFNRHGKLAVLFGRIVPAVRSLISVPAGLDRMPLVWFGVLTLAGTVVWNLVLSGLGVVLGNNWEQVLDFVGSYELVFYLLIAGLLAWFFIRRIKSLLQNKSSD